MYHRLRNHFGRTWWYSKVTKLNWKLISVLLEIVLILTQDRCTVLRRTYHRLRNRLHAPNELLGDVCHVESRLVRLEMVLVLLQDRCTVCTKRTIGSDQVLDAPDGTPR